MITDFCAVLLYLPTRDEWIEIKAVDEILQS